MERKYKGYTIGRCESVAFLCCSSLTWIVCTPKGGVRFATLKECKEWINKQIDKANK